MGVFRLIIYHTLWRSEYLQHAGDSATYWTWLNISRDLLSTLDNESFCSLFMSDPPLNTIYTILSQPLMSALLCKP